MKTRESGMLIALALVASALVASSADAQPQPQAVKIRGGLFVPKPKGAGETLDKDKATPKAGGADVVTLTSGDKLTGKVVSIEAGKRLTLKSPNYLSPVAVRLSALSRVRMKPGLKAKGDDVVRLTNGDRLRGKIVAITDGAVLLESNSAGAMRIARNVTESVSFSGGDGALIESAFENGQMTPWQKSRGTWIVKDGKLHSLTHGSHCTVFAPLMQTGPVTMVVKFKSTQRYNMYLDMILFASDKQNYYGRDSILVRFHSHNYYIQYCKDGGTRNVTNRNFGKRIQGGEFRLSFDPTTKKAKVWMDKTLLGEFEVTEAPDSGKYVMISSLYAGEISSARVLRGVVPPAGAGGKSKEKEHVLVLANKDRISAKKLTLADDQFTVQAPYGKLTMPAGNVRNVLFRSEGRERPRRRKGDVWVETEGSRFTVQLKSLTDKILVGKSDYMGEVKVLRPALRGLRFNIYK